ncbi:MAG: N-acetyltransferase [Burkholderiaceae bacterium]
MASIIRTENPADHSAIEAVAKAAFRDAPHAGKNEHFIIGALREADALTISLVAEMGGSIVGNVVISPVSISDGTKAWFGVGPVSVHPEFQGQGIGSLD